EEFPLPEEVPTASEDKFPLLIQSDATAEELYAAAEVIEFRDSYEAPTIVAATGSASEGTATKKGRTVAFTTEDMQKRKNDTFGGNEATKKTKKNMLKQQYGNFKAEGSETLEQTFNRLQAIVSHLQFLDIEIKQDDLNQKFLTSLAPEWLMHTIKKSESNSQNMAFISSAKNSSGKEDVNTACIPTANTNVSPASVNIGAVSISQDTAYAYIASQSSGSQIKFKDITQIDKDDMKKMDIKWNMALLSMRADRFWKKTGKKISIQGTNVVGFDKSKVECFNCHKMGLFAREKAPKALMAIDGVGWDWSFMENKEEDHALVADEEAPTEFALMAKTSAESEELSWTGIPEFADDTVTDYSRPSPAIENTSDDAQNRNPSVPETEASSSTISSKPFIKFVKAANPPTVAKSDKKETVRKPSVKYDELYRKPTKRKFPTGNTKFSTADLSNKGTAGNSQNHIDDKGYWDSGCSRHMTGNISYLFDYEPFDGGYVGCSRHMTGNISYLSDYELYDGGYVSFGQGGGKIISKEPKKISDALKDLSWVEAMHLLDFRIQSFHIEFLRWKRQCMDFIRLLEPGMIDEDDMEEMDIKWNMALLSMRADKFWKRTGNKISIQGSNERVRKESYRQGSKAEEKSSKALMAIDGVGWDWSYMANEEDHALVADGETPIEFALMANNENKMYVKSAFLYGTIDEEVYVMQPPGFQDPEFPAKVIAFCDYHNMIAILEKHNVDFHQIVDFVEASHIRIETTNEGKKMLATVDGKPRTIFESSIRRNIKLNDEEGISSLPDAELFENLAPMGYNILPNQKFTFQKGQFSHQWKVYNFSKMIFDGMVRNVNNKASKLLMYPRVNSLSFSCRTVPLFAIMLVTQGEGSGTPTKPHHTPHPEVQQSPHHDLSSSLHPTETTETIPTTTPTEISILRKYSRRATQIAQSKALPTAADDPASLLRDNSQGGAFPTISGLEAGHDRENIIKTSALPHDSTLRVTSLDADEGSMQQQLQELTDLCTRLQRQQTEMASKINAQDLEISSLKARIKLLKDKDKGTAELSGDVSPIKGRSLETWEEAVSTVGVPISIGLVPTVSAIFTTASVVTPYSRRKGKEKMVESDTPKKKKLQEQIDVQMAREIEEQMAREDQRMDEQIARDAEIARIYAEEELQMLIYGLDRNNEVIVKHLQEYEQSEAELTIGEKIDLINDLVKYQDHHAKILKYQVQQSKPLSKKEQREFYMSVLRSHSGWKTKHFRGITLEEIREKFIPVWK
nr:hypothetical protein [Tanacetum cinerariifolium]